MPDLTALCNPNKALELLYALVQNIPKTLLVIPAWVSATLQTP